MTERYLATTIGQLKRCGSANIIAILLSLTAQLLAGCQGNRLSGSAASSSVATGASGFLPLRGQG